DYSAGYFGRTEVVVAGNQRKPADSRPGINGQQRVDAAPERVDDDGLVVAGSPRVPDGMPAGIARVVGFARFLCAISGQVGDCAGCAGYDLRVAEVVVGRTWLADGYRENCCVIAVIRFLNTL